MESSLQYPALLVTEPANMRYFHRLPFGAGAIYLSGARRVFLSWAGREAPMPAGVELRLIERKDLGREAKGLMAGDAAPYLAVEKSVPLAIYSQLLDAIPDVRAVDGDPVRDLREIKSAWELEQIRSACEITDFAFGKALEIIRPGASELEIAAWLEYQMRLGGAEGSNKTIVAAGKNGAVPHHWPTGYLVQKGDFVTMDFGCTVNGYHSDLTRTVVVGAPTAKQKKIYETVLASQLAGLDAVKEGEEGSRIDGISRGIIDGTEFEGSFIHGLGHGIGLDIHEGTGLGKEERRRLKAGMVVSVEPGIYLEGYGGVRIEDIALVEKDRARPLELSPKQLIAL
ncbi:MAG: aminopeptidase P family protein [Clostridiales bacterium]|nr:aminopeptidase P family protein [Clostridiales bacterium]